MERTVKGTVQPNVILYLLPKPDFFLNISGALIFDGLIHDLNFSTAATVDHNSLLYSCFVSSLGCVFSVDVSDCILQILKSI